MALHPYIVSTSGHQVNAAYTILLRALLLTLWAWAERAEWGFAACAAFLSVGALAMLQRSTWLVVISWPRGHSLEKARHDGDRAPSQ